LSEFDVGARLREVRTQKDFSQRKLAERAGVPHGQISMIEKNRSSPSVATLRKILGGIPMSMVEFFEPEQNLSERVFFTPNDLLDLTSRISTDPTSKSDDTISLKQVGDARANNLQILHEHYEIGADTGPDMLEHVGNEGGIVISGEIEITVNDQVHVLKAGDSFLFDSRAPHRFRNISDRPAEIISACTPPYL